MGNTRLKKNPFMSMRLRMANRVAGTLCGQAKVRVKRQRNAVIAEAIAQPAPMARPSHER